MSHLTTVKVRVQDLQALKHAVKDLKVEFRSDQRTFQWYGKRSPCAHAIVLPGCAHEIGIVQNGDHYVLQYDAWGPGRKLEIALGKDLQKLKQQYAAQVARKKLRGLAAKGYCLVAERRTKNGAIELIYRSATRG